MKTLTALILILISCLTVCRAETPVWVVIQPSDDGEQPVRVITGQAAREATALLETSEKTDRSIADTAPAPVEAAGVSETGLAMLLFVFAMAVFLGVELISKVPSQLHTPLMSGSNAISGITIVGALLATGRGWAGFGTVLGFLAVIFAMINVVGGYMVTDRMLGMFKSRKQEGDA